MLSRLEASKRHTSKGLRAEGHGSCRMLQCEADRGYHKHWEQNYANEELPKPWNRNVKARCQTNGDEGVSQQVVNTVRKTEWKA